jgi:WD40 repeat protein
MAPEQIRDPQTVDTRADIYALGVLLFELLTSRQPHDCKTGALTDVIRRVCDEPAPRLSAIDRRLKGELESIVACALEKDRERRYRSAADLSDDLRRWLRGEPIAARRDRLLDALGRSAARNRKVILVGAAALAVAIAVGAWSTAQAARNARLADSERAARDRAVLSLDLAQREKSRADSESARLRNRLYASNIGFAQAALASADTGRLQRLLADCPIDQRGWEWRYLASFADSADRTAVVNQEGMGYISIDPLRGRIAVERFGDPVKIFPLEGGPELDRYTMERGVYRVSYAPDGTLFTADASGTLEGHAPGPDRAVTVFDTGARGPHFNVRAFPNPQEVIVSDRLGVSKLGPGGAAHWRREGLAAAVLAVAGDTGAVLCGGVSAGTTLLNGHDGAVVWSSEWPAEESRGAAISPDGALAAIASRSGGVSLFDGETGAKLWSVQLSASRTMSIAISADTRSVLIGATDGLIHVLDSATGNPRGMLRGHTGAVTSIEPIEDGRVVSYSRDGTLRWWTVSEIVSGETSEHVADSGLCAVMPFGDGFLTQSFGGELRVFDRSAGAVIWGDNSAVVWRATVSEPAMAAAATRGDGTVVVWKIDEPADARVVKVSETRVSKSAFSSDGAMIAAADDSGRLSIISAETGTVLSQRAVSEHAAIGVLWLPDDSLVMTTGNDGVLRGWRVSADGEIEEGSSAFERPICDTPLWEIAAPRDGRRIAVSGENGIVYLLDTREGSLRELPGHSGPAFGLAFHPSEPRLASVGADGRLRIWDTESGEELLQLGPGGPSLASVAFSANGDRVAAAGADGVLRVWSTPE